MTTTDWNYLKPENQHPACTLFEDLDEKDLKALATDIKEHGQREPILVFGGLIVDGKNRLAACKLAGVSPRIDRLDGRDITGDYFHQVIDEDLIAFSLSKNLSRRHLTPAQRGAIVLQADNLSTSFREKREAAEREREDKERKEREADAAVAKVFLKPEPKPAAVSNDTKAKPAAKPAGRKRERLAEKADVGTETITRLEKIAKAAPDRLQAIAKGKMTIAQASENLPKPAKTAKAAKKKYPLLPPPPVMPATNPETVKTFDAVLKIVNNLLSKMSEDEKSILELTKGVKPANIAEYNQAAKIEEQVSKLYDKADKLNSFFIDYCEERKNADIVAARYALNFRKGGYTAVKGGYNSNGDQSTWDYSATETRDREVTEALKLALAPFGYRKTVSQRFKLTDDFNEVPVKSAKK